MRLRPCYALWRIRLRSRVRQNEAPHVSRRVTENRKGRVTSHRQSADDRIFDVQRIEQIDDVARVIVDRG